MRLSISGIVFLLLGAALLGWSAGAGHVGSRIAGISAGIAFVLLGIGYMAARPGLLCKRASGRMHPASYAMFWPYHLMSYASLIFFRLARVVPFQEIVPGLYLGGWLFPWERARLRKEGIASVLDLTCELGEASFLRDVKVYRCIPLLDGTAPTRAQLQAGIDFIREQLPNGPVYVHCAMGHGRSATVVAGYLMATGAVADLPAAVSMIRARRPGIRLNAAQRRSVEQLKL